MNCRYRLFRRSNGTFYIEDIETRKQQSLGTKNRNEANRLFAAKNEAYEHPHLSFQLARAYFTASDPGCATRTWQMVFEELAKTKLGPTLYRWQTAIKDHAFDSIRKLTLLETRSDHFMTVLNQGTVSTNVYLRRVHNYALDMNWLPTSVVIKRQWPKVRHQDKRAITLDEHLRIVEGEHNPERKAFYQLAWHLGASQSDLTNLHAEDIDWTDRTICFERAKTRWRGLQPPMVCFGAEVENILLSLPRMGRLFPYLSTVGENDRATAFRERCRALGITGITLHSYRYAWAERAKSCGYPERFAQQALGHNSKAVHRAYSKKAKVMVPALEDYERTYLDGKIIPMKMQTGTVTESALAVNKTD